MELFYKYRLTLISFAFSILILNGCTERKKKEETPEINEVFSEVDLQAIKDRGKLIAITGYSSTSYFIYRGQPMGYEYELLENYASNLGVDLEILIAPDLNSMFEMLKRGEGDMIAYNLTVTKDRADKVSFATHHNEVRQVLVQRKPENWREMPIHKTERELLRNPLELEGKTVYVQRK